MASDEYLKRVLTETLQDMREIAAHVEGQLLYLSHELAVFRSGGSGLTEEVCEVLPELERLRPGLEVTRKQDLERSAGILKAVLEAAER